MNRLRIRYCEQRQQSSNTDRLPLTSVSTISYRRAPDAHNPREVRGSEQDTEIEDGKRVGRPPFSYTVEDGFLQQVPTEYVRARDFIREVRKGREKRATSDFFEIPESKMRSILDRAEPTTTFHSITIAGNVNEQ